MGKPGKFDKGKGKSGKPGKRDRSPAQDSEYTYTDDEGEAPVVAGGAWGAPVARAGPSSYGAAAYKGAAYDPYRQAPFDPYSQYVQSGKGGYDPYARSPAGGHYVQPPAVYNQPPPAHGAPPAASGHRYPPPPPGYGGAPGGYNSYSDPYARSKGDKGRGRSRSPRGDKAGGKGKKDGKKDKGGKKGKGKKGDGAQNPTDGGAAANDGFERRKKGKKYHIEDADVEQDEDAKKPDLDLDAVLRRPEASVTNKEGSRFLQLTLKEGDSSDIDNIFNAVMPIIRMASDDMFGCFVVIRLIDAATDEQRDAISHALEAHTHPLSLNPFGCRVVQKALEVMSTENQLRLCHQVRANFLEVLKNMHGNHVISMAAGALPLEELGWIIEACEKDIDEVCLNIYGNRTVQRLCERCDPYLLDGLIDKCISRTPKLSKDKAGNYVVQAILLHGRLEDKRRVLAAVTSDPLHYAKDKCGSNVLERCMEIGDVGEHALELNAERNALLRKIIGEPSDPMADLRQLLDDRFGNFIVQKMMKIATGEEREMLKTELALEEPALRNSIAGKHILKAMSREFGFPELEED